MNSSYSKRNPEKGILHGVCQVAVQQTALLVLTIVGVWCAGCQLVNYSGGARNDSASKVMVERVAQAIPENVLRSNGLETIWTQKALSGSFRNIFVVGDDLFAVEERQLGHDASAGKAYSLIDFDRKDGLRRWVWDLKAPVKHPPYVFHYPPQIVAEPKEDEVFLVQKDKVYCLDYKYGTTLWKSDHPFSISSGVIASDEHYFVGSFDGKLICLEKRKPVEEWFWFTEGEVRTNGMIRDIFSYFTSTGGTVYRFHDSLGMRHERAWQFRTGAGVRGAPFVFAGHVFVGSSDYKLYCLRNNDGSKKWDFQAQAPIFDSPVAMKFRPNLPIIFCISDDNRPTVNRRTLWAVNADNGKLLWKFDHVERLVAVGRKSIFLMLDARANRGKTIVAVDGDTGAEKFALAVGEFDFIPTSVSAQAPTRGQRSILYLVHKSGLIQAVGEKL